jgi:hypothetical protein
VRLAALFLGFALAGTALAGGSTLLIYDSPSKPFSLQNEIEPIAILLARFDPAIERRMGSEVRLADMEKAARIVVAGIGGFPAMSPPCLEYLEKTQKPVVGVGAAATLAIPNSPRPSKPSVSLPKGQLVYLGREWPAQVDPYFPAAVDSSLILARIHTADGEKAICWRSGNRLGFAALPAAPPLSMVFSDAVMDLFSPGVSTAPGILFIVRDFNPSCSPDSFRRLVDYFSHDRIPFAVTAQMRDLPEGTTPMPREEFLAALQYAELHGGRVFVRGGEGLKEAEKFAPVKICGIEEPNQPDPTAIQIGRPTLARTPGDPTSPFFIHAPMRLAGGGWLWPANVRGGLDGDLVSSIRTQVRDIIPFRGAVAGIVIPAWLPFQSMRALADAARSFGIAPIDPLTAVPEPLSQHHP